MDSPMISGITRFLYRFGLKGVLLWYGIGILPAAVLFRFIGVVPGFLWIGGLVGGHLLQLYIHASAPPPEDDTRLRVIIRELETPGEYGLHEMAGKTGLKAHVFEQQLLDLMRLETHTLAYYPPEKRIYVPKEGRDLGHCPRCAADLERTASGRCPNCKLRFSRVILEEPYRYI